MSLGYDNYYLSLRQLSHSSHQRPRQVSGKTLGIYSAIYKWKQKY